MRHGTTSILTRLLNFNPRIPQGMRRARCSVLHAVTGFQSTHSAGNATQQQTLDAILTQISIHAFRRECDYAAL